MGTTALTARHRADTAPASNAKRLIVVRKGAPECLGFTVKPDSALMTALSSGDMATRALARASFVIVAQP